jgi:hypothetical protein
MDSYEILIWLVRLAMIFALIAGIGLLIGAVRQSFLSTHNTETHIIMQETITLLIKEHKNTLGREYPVVVKADFTQGTLHRLNTSLSIGIRFDLINSSNDTVAGPIYINQDYYDTYEPISGVEELDIKDVQFPVLIEDKDNYQIGYLKARGVYRVQ